MITVFFFKNITALPTVVFPYLFTRCNAGELSFRSIWQQLTAEDITPVLYTCDHCIYRIAFHHPEAISRKYGFADAAGIEITAVLSGYQQPVAVLKKCSRVSNFATANCPVGAGAAVTGFDAEAALLVFPHENPGIVKQIKKCCMQGFQRSFAKIFTLLKRKPL